jgi:zinc transport system ATP-binding protein
MSIIICRDVSFAYEGVTVVGGLNFEVCGGDYLCVVGENGSGKSTLIKGLLRLISPVAGSISINGVKQSEIGYLAQQTAVQKDFPACVYEVVLSGRLASRGILPFYSRKDKSVAQEYISKFGIYSLRRQSFRDLSGGQQQRTLLARALCAAKKMLIIDEPAGGLDPIAVQEFYRFIESVNKENNLTVIMVSHDVRSVAKYASHILHLKNRQIFFGATKDYLRSEISKSFMGGNIL